MLASLALRTVDALRAGAWFDGDRARGYLVILAVLMAATMVGYLAMSNGLLDPMGRPIGTDFSSFWTASQLALAGAPADVWNMAAHNERQVAAFGPDAGYAAFFYPPPYLLICLPLALLPYLVSLVVWLAVTGAAWVQMARAWLGEVARERMTWLALAAFPAVIVNIGHGQNGFLTAALLGGGALLHQKRPYLAGALFGALVIKPHLALLVPIFLIFGGNWRSFLSAGVTALGLCLLSWLAFGTEAWLAFIETSATARAVLDDDLVGFAKMQSAFAAVRLVGGPAALAWAVQGAALCGALYALWRVRRAGDDRANGAAFACATLLATPFLLDYDLTLLIVPLAWMFANALRGGFLPWERMALLAAFVLPLISRPLAAAAHLPIAPLVIALLMLCIVRRAEAGRVA